ncbi:MAG: HAMP domain-containing protein [Bacteroidales bacterium]|nr:HAMP domain-containing protein [Bacteroidales bacterium]
MKLFKRRLNLFFRRSAEKKVYKSYIRFRSSIYGRVVFIIVGSLFVLFILFNIVFRTIYTDLFETTIKQTGDRVSSIVEGSLYYSMLENDKTMLQRELDIISNMTGINEVNMYNEYNQLAYSSLSAELDNRGDPNCTACHADFSSIFSYLENEYRIMDNIPGCGVYQSEGSERHLLIRKPIMNEPSCYTAACHAHSEDEEVLGSLLINMPLKDLDTFLDRSSMDFLLLALLITGFMVTFLVLFTRRRIKDPLHSIIRASEAVSSGDTSIRIKLEPHLLDDMRLVSEAFNNMLNNIDEATEELQNWSYQLEYKVQKKSEALSRAQNELIHVERIASLGKLSSSVAHEINNPLSGILVYSKLVHKQLSNSVFDHPKKESILKNLKLIESETRRCGDIVKGLLDFSRKDQEDFENEGIHKLLHETYALMAHSIKMANISFRKELKAEKDLVFCSPNQVKQACVALLVNSTEAIRENGEINIRTYNDEDNHICIEIRDNGIGISEEELSHIFEPFYSTKRESSGIGLGLSIVHGIVENHKGMIRVRSQPGKGTVIKIILPLSGD